MESKDVGALRANLEYLEWQLSALEQRVNLLSTEERQKLTRIRERVEKLQRLCGGAGAAT